jgi:hypothetical protein
MPSSRRHALSLLLTGTLAAIAALFAPDGRWLGVDPGAVGSALFVLSAGAAIALFVLRGDEIFPEDMSIAERRAWIGVIFLAMLLAGLARQLWALSLNAAAPDRIEQLFSHHFVQRWTVLTIIWAVLSHLIGRSAGGVEMDERDLRLRHRADRGGDLTLVLIVVLAVCLLAALPRALLEWWLEPIVLANVLIGLLIAKVFIEHLVLTYSYRAGRA